MIRLYLEAVNCYYDQGKKYQRGGNHGLSDYRLRCAEDALEQARLTC